MMRFSWWMKHRRKVAAAAIWGSALAVALFFMRANELDLAELMLQVVLWGQVSPLAPLVYLLLYALRPLTLFSSVALTLAGGFLFGPLWGVVWTVIAANLSATVAFFVGRALGRELLAETATEGMMQRYASRMRQSSFETVLIMRCIFLPYDLVSYLAGFLRIRYRPFLLATALGSMPGTIAFVWMGASLAPEDLSRFFLNGEPPGLDWRMLALSAAMFVVSMGVSRYLKQRERGNPSPVAEDIVSETI
ncbi:MAG: TVP38/TMEM64 family protein [Caldilinea sp.]|nr:TVP38/TMEM64 family protein [Caldilinea sp.]MDW8441365.1 TVP38/TMEM64 family protein [Caldilineaceae bacterium]